MIQLNYGYGTRITHQKQYIINGSLQSTGLVPRFWAQRKIDELRLFPEIPENENLVLELGKKYSIVTPNTSIIVLEKLEQYVKYEIEPPVNLTKMHNEWMAIMSLKKMEKKCPR